MKTADELPPEYRAELNSRLLRELAQRLYWGGVAYGLFATLISLQLRADVRLPGILLSALLIATGAARTVFAARVAAAGERAGIQDDGRKLVGVASTQSILFLIFTCYALWFVRGETILECLIVVGVAGLSSVSAGFFSPFPRLAWRHVAAQVLPVYVWSVYAMPRYGWVMVALVVIHAAAIAQLISMNGRYACGMLETQLRLEAQSEDLRQARDQAEAAGTARMRFLTNMSHEIRTPLNGIIGLAEVIGDTPLTEDQRELLNDLTRSGSHLLTIVNDILDMAKVNSGKLTIDRVEFNLPQVIRDVAAPAAALADARRLRFLVNTPPDLPQVVVGDPVRLRQIISNLLSNAVKFTTAGEVRFDVSIPKPGWLRVDVTDTGIGLSATQLAALFQEFHQADSSTSRRFGGSGLGLAISRKLVELMSGRIWVDSAIGKGARFSFEIPLQVSEVAARRSSPDPARGGVQALPKGLRVLLAEDNPVNQLVIQRLVAAAGVSVAVAENGREAVEMHRASPFDLILMDCQMPEVDGYEATRQIRALAGAVASVPIVGVTANAFNEDRERSFSAGMDGYVAKPINRARLLEAMGRALAKSSQESESR